MKQIILTAIITFASVAVFAQSPVKVSPAVQIVEASCGKCNFGAKEKGCSLYVRINNKAYPVRGAAIDDFGDAHDASGMCKAIRRAEVVGEIRKDVFYATSFKLLPAEIKKP